MAGPSVEQLWRAVFPAARSVGDADALVRPVAWVRVLKPRTPAFDALEADDLAIVPVAALANLSAIGADPASVVDAITSAGACGLLVVGDAEDAAARVLLAATPHQRLAALTLPEADVHALERSAISFVVNARAELDARAATLEFELERAALAGAGLDGLVAVISGFFARPVAIEADDGSVLAVHAGAGGAGPPVSVSGYLRNRRGVALRVPLPSSGALALLGPDEASDLERIASNRIASVLALALAAPTTGAAAAGRRRTVERLPSDGPPWVALVARQLDDGDKPTLDEREQLRGALRQLEPARRLQLRGDATSLELRLVYAPPAGAGAGHEFAARVSRRIGRPVALSEPFDAGPDRAAREANARASLEAFEALPALEQQHAARPDGAIVVRAEMLPALRLMAGLASLPDARRHARALLQPLLSGRPARDADALATLRAVLDHAGMAEAAAALGIHRNTLAYRLAAIERRTGWQMSDPFVRFGLSLAVWFVQNDQTAGV